ncbi:hypothetical protein GSU75_00654 [Pseudomonas savastanoi pv. phaseolicola]|uniref:Uncharacterized protein n=1 Tax=Pseudomonas savastanoi pv. glycinea TaxID=318 RepID=A0A3M3FI71_PSESG|nr:hypothetical protein [Pseudomonas savastanoi pv. phaseolicola]MBN4183847.1 hypothetical protein [Pseudomonas savastanoi pv. phaseolicola]RMM61601.1 hypothetical protein ALQ74_200060 [Pseudomonas savastanoi pv. glycinea]RMQ61830.1 hypothetical protein ALQ02_200083 [Pseudomonas savastanoi pv. phaseolicola]
MPIRWLNITQLTTLFALSALWITRKLLMGAGGLLNAGDRAKKPLTRCITPFMVALSTDVIFIDGRNAGSLPELLRNLRCENSNGL